VHAQPTPAVGRRFRGRHAIAAVAAIVAGVVLAADLAAGRVLVAMIAPLLAGGAVTAYAVAFGRSS
jgi:hypothetical protein